MVGGQGRKYTILFKTLILFCWIHHLSTYPTDLKIGVVESVLRHVINTDRIAGGNSGNCSVQNRPCGIDDLLATWLEVDSRHTGLGHGHERTGAMGSVLGLGNHFGLIVVVGNLRCSALRGSKMGKLMKQKKGLKYHKVGRNILTVFFGPKWLRLAYLWSLSLGVRRMFNKERRPDLL